MGWSQVQGPFKIYSLTEFVRLTYRDFQTAAERGWSWFTDYFRIQFRVYRWD